MQTRKSPATRLPLPPSPSCPAVCPSRSPRYVFFSLTGPCGCGLRRVLNAIRPCAGLDNPVHGVSRYVVSFWREGRGTRHASRLPCSIPLRSSAALKAECHPSVLQSRAKMCCKTSRCVQRSVSSLPAVMSSICAGQFTPWDIFFPVAEVSLSPFPPCAYCRWLERRSTLLACLLWRAI